MDLTLFEDRKREHIRHALDPAHQASGLSGLARIHLNHEALPELDLDEITLRTTCLGKPAATPFFVAAMTAGHPDAPLINRTLALGCAKRGWAMGVGSQRRELEDSNAPAIDQWKRIRDEAPSLSLFGNLGISQLAVTPLDQIKKLLTSIGAQALVVHTNALQEAIQPEGTPRFRGATEALRRTCNELEIPVILKETGCGFSFETLCKLREIGLAAIDVSGLGGTHWGRIEGARAQASSVRAGAAETFAEWGEPTVDSVLAATKALAGSSTEVWASGGVRSGLDAAKLLALGAVRVGYAQPALKAALDGVLEQWLERQEFELKVALFCTGSASPAELANKEGVWKRSDS